VTFSRSSVRSRLVISHGLFSGGNSHVGSFDSRFKSSAYSGEFEKSLFNPRDLSGDFVSKFLIIVSSFGFSMSFGGFGHFDVFFDLVTDGKDVIDDSGISMDFFGFAKDFSH